MSFFDLEYLGQVSELTSGSYLLAINGRIIQYTNRNIKIEIDSDKKYKFYVDVKHPDGFIYKESSDGKVEEYVKREMNSNMLYGMDLKGYFSASVAALTLQNRMFVNSGASVFIYETVPYYSLKGIVESKSDHTFTNSETGQDLTSAQMNKLKYEFRKASFESYLAVLELGTFKKLMPKENLHAFSRAYTLALFAIKGIHHPLIDDPEFAADFANTRLGSTINRAKVNNNKPYTMSFITHYELSMLLDVGGAHNPTLLHFRPALILKIITARYIDDLNPLLYPIKGAIIWIRNQDAYLPEGMENYYTDKQFKAVDDFIEYKTAENYSSMDSFLFYFGSIESHYFRAYGYSQKGRMSNNNLIAIVNEIKFT